MVLPSHVILSLFRGLIKSDYEVIWQINEKEQVSLKDEAKEDKEDKEKAFISNDLPQRLIIDNDKVKLVFNTCDWEDIMDCVYAGKPIMGLPYHNEQLVNSDLLTSAETGQLLAPRPIFMVDPFRNDTYSKKVVAPITVRTTIKSILKEDSEFTFNSQRLS